MNLAFMESGNEGISGTHGRDDLKVVYLFGAGASHGSARWSGSNTGILMYDLREDISNRIHEVVESTDEYRKDKALQQLISDVLDPDDSDIEQVITFLEESGRQSHNRLAADLRRVFRESLTAKLKHITDELSIVPSQLYAALIDLYQIPSFTETLGGFLTLNYDGLIEHAIHSQHGKIVDYGISLSESPANPDDSITLLKLHGSFDWLNEWPIRLHQPTEGSDPLWIPPGIQKAKEAYPFNILWGRARELLECDVLRIVGCNLSANDWDLVSMLFRTKHGHSANRVFEIELIDSPRKALELQKRFPYLPAFRKHHTSRALKTSKSPLFATVPWYGSVWRFRM